MNNTVCNKKTVLALSLAMLVSVFSNNVYADCCKKSPAVYAAGTLAGLFIYDTVKGNELTLARLGRNATAAALAALLARYFSKESVAEADYKETGDVAKLKDVKNIATKEYWENFLQVVDEKVVGQRPKDNKPKFEQNNGKIEMTVSLKRPAKGLMGTAEDLTRPLKEAFEATRYYLPLLLCSKSVRDVLVEKLGAQTLVNDLRQ